MSKRSKIHLVGALVVVIAIALFLSLAVTSPKAPLTIQFAGYAEDGITPVLRLTNLSMAAVSCYWDRDWFPPKLSIHDTPMGRTVEVELAVGGVKKMQLSPVPWRSETGTLMVVCYSPPSTLQRKAQDILKCLPGKLALTKPTVLYVEIPTRSQRSGSEKSSIKCRGQCLH